MGKGCRCVEDKIMKVLLLLVLSGAAYQDYKEKEIDVRIPIFSAVIGCGLHLYFGEGRIQDILPGICVGIAFILLTGISGGAIGAGDGIMLMATGTFLGFWRNISMLMTALMFTSIAALYFMVVKKKGKDYRLPFLPFLLVAYLVELI